MDPSLPGFGPLADITRHNLVLPTDAWSWIDVLAGTPLEPVAEDTAHLTAAGPEFFRAALAAFDAVGADLGALAAEIRARTGRRGAALFMPLRIALTGRHDGPELAPLIAAIPPERVRARLAARAGLDRAVSLSGHSA
jgi:glutamyl-tRNA synthetase